MGLFLDHHSHSFYTEYAFLIDEEQGYCYIKKLLWYTDLKVPEEKEEELKKLLLDNLSKEKGETIVRTIAQKYIEEGEARDEAMGIEKRTKETAINMLKQNADIKYVTAVTGMTLEEVLKLKNKL